MKTRHIMIGIGILIIAGLTACSDTSKKGVGTQLPAFNLVEFCSNPLNKLDTRCTQACITDPTQIWCIVAPQEKFSCPLDGTFKAVNPFTGAELAFPATATVADVSGDYYLGLAPFSDGTTSTVFAGRGNILYADINILETTAKADMGAPITGMVTAIIEGIPHVIVATNQNIKLVPFVIADGVISFTADGIKTVAAVGGVKQLIATPSIDLSGSKQAEVPPGIYSSVSLPPSGEIIKENAVAGENYIFAVSASGNVWRFKAAHLLKGGCAESLYKPVNDLIPEKMATDGKYVALITNPSDATLPLLAGVSTDVPEGINTLIYKKFYRLMNQIAMMGDPKQVIKTLDLATSTNGSYKDVGNSYNTNDRYIANDLIISDTSLFMTAYSYNITNNAVKIVKSDAEVYKLLFDTWTAARTGSDVEDPDNYVSTSGLVLIDVNLTNITTVTPRQIAHPAGTKIVPTSFFATITAGGDSIYIRGENNFFNIKGKDDLDDIAKEKVGNDLAISATPLFSVYDTAHELLYTSFIGSVEALQNSGNVTTFRH